MPTLRCGSAADPWVARPSPDLLHLAPGGSAARRAGVHGGVR
ncbi:hypothetical protein ACFFX0_27110 [Citricoccus parietis]|uniref:Uncharacterized protein n=1 Tax=Citricoccus parietis TaxID=592307 RepID=A0ABV5G7S2_9MICC